MDDTHDVDEELIFGAQNSNYNQAFVNQLHDLHGCFHGIHTFLNYEYKPHEHQMKVVEELGSAKLLRCDNNIKTDLPVVLLVPSLINKFYILDLMPGRSIISYLIEQGFIVYVVSWNEPTLDEQGFCLADYVNHRLVNFVEKIIENNKSKLNLIGYCLGGLLSIAMATVRPHLIAKLVLIATPWDFNQMPITGAKLEDPLNKFYPHYKPVPAYLLSYFFYLQDYQKIYQKFIDFGKLTPGSQEAELFVRVEKWAYDGISVVYKVMQELIEFSKNNILYNEQWNVGDVAIMPSNLNVKSLIVAPMNDRIVPYESCASLYQSIPSAQLLSVNSGHIGMIIGRKASNILWKPLKNWIHDEA